MRRLALLLGCLLLIACSAGEPEQAPPSPTAADVSGEAPAPVASERGGETPAAAPAAALPMPTATLAVAPQPAEPTRVAESGAEAVPAEAIMPATIQTVTISAVDGLAIKGTLSTPVGKPAPAILLLHMLGSDRQAWDPFVAELIQAGYAALAIDMRGHGNTGGAVDWALAEDDTRRAWQFLASRPEVDQARTVIVGASIGSNLALRAVAAEPGVIGVALLSPGLDYRGVTTEDALTAFGDRPLLIIASLEDTYSADSSRTLAEQAGGGATELVLLDGAGHGTSMFEGSNGTLAEMLLTWLAAHLSPP